MVEVMVFNSFCMLIDGVPSGWERLARWRIL
jgi:hypothetical protein